MRQGKITGIAKNALREYLGADVTKLAAELSKKKDYSEFKLAEALGKDVNETRNLLYQLHNLNLASFIKKKDHKIGWYIYYWTFHEERVNGYVLKERKSRLEMLKDTSSRRNGQNSFQCRNRCASLDFDKAFEFSFHCPECGELLEQEAEDVKRSDSLEEIGALEREIRGMEETEETDRKHDKEKNELLEEKEIKEKKPKA